MFLFFANCVTFEDSLQKSRVQCRSLFKSLKLEPSSDRNKVAYADCVSKMAIGYEEYGQAQAIRGIAWQLFFMSIFGSVIVFKK